MSRSPGQIAYEAYGANRDWKTVSGAPMPTWAEQKPEISAAWEASAAGVMAAAITPDAIRRGAGELLKRMADRRGHGLALVSNPQDLPIPQNCLDDIAAVLLAAFGARP